MQYREVNIYGFGQRCDQVKLNPYDHIDVAFVDAFQITQQLLKLHKRLRHHLVGSSHFQCS
jgi:hypothetical protein